MNFQHGKTPLHYASEVGRADFVELLLKGNVNVDAKDEVGFYIIFNDWPHHIPTCV